MRELVVSKNEAGQRFDKYLFKYLNKAGSGFVYQMLRKKNIVLNDKKAAGNERLNVGDVVKLYLAEDTINSFIDLTQNKKEKTSKKTNIKLDIIYRDDNVLLVNKPSGILSQKAVQSDISINEVIIDYVLENNIISEKEFHTFKPSVCNRLDRNTSGIIAAGISLKGSQMLSELFRDRTIEKYYLALVKGKVTESKTIEGYLTKDTISNKVNIDKSNGEDYIKTAYEPVSYFNNMTLLMVHLYTGKTHQIRAHLASIGHPIVGDMKYGNKAMNDEAYRKYGIKNQLLHAYKLVFPKLSDEFEKISGKTIICNLPKYWPVKYKE